MRHSAIHSVAERQEVTIMCHSASPFHGPAGILRTSNSASMQVGRLCISSGAIEVRAWMCPSTLIGSTATPYLTHNRHFLALQDMLTPDPRCG